ncbi:hypothetical protein LXL04_034150 [Taraxacum kok-saghyz]
MKIVRHPNIVRLHEVHKGKLSEKEARGYFQQLIDAVSHCHSKGVFHRDLKLLEPDPAAISEPQLQVVVLGGGSFGTSMASHVAGRKTQMEVNMLAGPLTDCFNDSEGCNCTSQADRADREAGSQADRADREGGRNNFCMIIMDFDTTTYKC